MYISRSGIRDCSTEYNERETERKIGCINRESNLLLVLIITSHRICRWKPVLAPNSTPFSFTKKCRKKWRLLIMSNFSNNHFTVFDKLSFIYTKCENFVFELIHLGKSHITIVEIKDSGERGISPVAIRTINPQREYWQSRG